ncbi:MAG: AMP-binding protein [Deltaproteobacteria bacterium]|nr:AMP-binding protein [Deltaproteobacteria bacterium]
MTTWEDIWTGKSITDALKEAVKRYGKKNAFIFVDKAIDFEKLWNNSELAARGLIKVGVQKGDRVGIWMAGYPEWAYLFYACARIGAVMVPVNTRYKPFEVEYVLNKSKVKTLILKDEGGKGKDYLGVLKELIPEIEALSPDQISSNRLPHLRQVVVSGEKQYPWAFSYDELLDMGASISQKTLSQAEKKVSSDDTALIQFTSGTTAMPKGAVLFQNAMLRGSYYNNYFLGVTDQDLFFSPQPFYHVGGSIQVMLAPVVTGCTIIVQTYFDTSEALKLMEDYQCTVTMGHQPHWIEYLNHPELKKRKLVLERAEIFAPPDVRKRVYQEMGIKVLLSPYSMTETHLGGCVGKYDDPIEKCLTTVGRCVPGMELLIRDPENGEILADGNAGEVCFRGWGVMRGYLDDPEKTAEVIDHDGWFRTGDLGIRDSDGYIRLVGRIKDMIRVGGENVAASDVEGFILQHEKVKQVVAVGAPEERLGEIVVVFIELKPGLMATESEIIDFCKSGLASFKVPRQVRFVTEWPMTGAGKIQKYQLQELVAKKGV